MLCFAVLIQIVTLYRWANVKMMWLTALCIFFSVAMLAVYVFFRETGCNIHGADSALYSSINEKFVYHIYCNRMDDRLLFEKESK